ncbi:MAG: hypothetical protein K6T75_11190 [Acetobacteraceae bacterium]|nr:hypothetical protein [Acetobacteraceae bacterium]
MTGGYGSQRDYLERVKAGADARREAVELALREVFAPLIETRQVEVVTFSSMSALDLARAILARPIVLKPILACCNVAPRAVERDLGIKNLSPYAPRLTEDQANVIAGYLRFGEARFRKSGFQVEGERFELDAAAPAEGEIRVGVDVQRIEARRDIHKRCDEVVNKASRMKSAFPRARFGVVIYYAFVEEHVNLANRLRSPDIDGVVFASEREESVESARLLLSTLRVAHR